MGLPGNRGPETGPRFAGFERTKIVSGYPMQDRVPQSPRIGGLFWAETGGRRDMEKRGLFGSPRSLERTSLRLPFP